MTTTIKLRRGLSTAFAANNPVLQAGEPAFATDTGVLKIGDGTTAYNSLPSIGASPDLSNYVQKTDYASTASAGVIKVDGSTITVSADGTISAASGGAQINDTTASTTTVYSSTKCNNTYVDLTNTQTVGGRKTFTSSVIVNPTSFSTGSKQMSLRVSGSDVTDIAGRQLTSGSLAFFGNSQGYGYTLIGGQSSYSSSTAEAGRVVIRGNKVPCWNKTARFWYTSPNDLDSQGEMLAYAGAFNSSDFTVTPASNYQSLNISLKDVVKSTDVTNIVKLTQAQYDALVSGGTVDANTFYVIIPSS